MSLLSRIKDWFMSRIEVNKLEKAFNIKIASDVNMQDLIEMWQSVYQGHPNWVGGGNDQVLHTLNVASTMCSDLATKAVSEISITSKNNSEALAQFTEDEINQQIRQQLEYGLAGGAFICRPYYDAEMNKISLSWYTADKFIPVDWSGKRCVSGIFIDQDVVDSEYNKIYYTKLELQKWHYGDDGNGGNIKISVRLYKSTDPSDLGVQIPLTDYPKWANIEPEAFIQSCTTPLFVYASMPFANNKAINCKAGVSLYKDGMAQLEQIDRCWDDLNWELQSSQNKVFVDEQMLETVRKDNGEIVPRLDSKDKRLFKVMDANGSVNKYMEAYSPAIRQADITATLKTNLSLLCSSCRLDAGAYVYDEQAQAVTATEIKTKNQKTYQTICDIQKWTITPAVKSIINAVQDMQNLYGVPALNVDEIDIDFGDSILVDAETDKINAQRETQLGLRSKLNYLIEFRGLSEEEARKELAIIEQETPQQMNFFDNQNE